MTISPNYVRELIIKTATDTTGDAIKEGRLEIPPRDAVEFLVRLEAAFDCVLGRLRYVPLSMDIDELVGIVLKACNEGDTESTLSASIAS